MTRAIDFLQGDEYQDVVNRSIYVRRTAAAAVGWSVKGNIL